MQKFGRYCDRHDKRSELTGHPLGHTVRSSELKFYLKLTSGYVKNHRDHPAIAACLQWLNALVYGSRLRGLQRRSNATPWQRLYRWLDQLEQSGVCPEELLSVAAAFYLYLEDQPQAFRSDRHFRHQLAIRFLRKAPAPFVQGYRAGVGGRKYDRITVGVRDLLAKLLAESIGVPCLGMARAIHRSLYPVNPANKAAIMTPLPPYQSEGISTNE
ncbi:MAG TPA: hypothetical protein VM639_22940 [Dongiaceae bacterium]|nr:hypothetical protein [Dongiaceae bacterium]